MYLSTNNLQDELKMSDSSQWTFKNAAEHQGSFRKPLQAAIRSEALIQMRHMLRNMVDEVIFIMSCIKKDTNIYHLMLYCALT